MMSSNQQAPGRPDPLVDEVRTMRRTISEELGQDVGRLCEHLRHLEAAHRDRVVQRDRSAEANVTPKRRDSPY